MTDIPEIIDSIKIGTPLYREHEGGGCYVWSVADVGEAEYDNIYRTINHSGLTFVESHNFGTARFTVFKSGGDALFLSHYPSVNELRAVYEPDCPYLALANERYDEKVQPLITQIDLEDFGNSYVVRLCDGRFVIFDGGWEFEPDADKLYKVLCEQSDGSVPTIAAWFMTHAHIDHYRCYLVFNEKYGDKVKIERFLYNFPDPDINDAERLPLLLSQDEYIHIGRLNDAVKATGAAFFRPHSGQVYRFGGAVFEVLSTPDDVFRTPMRDCNTASLVIKMTIAGQTTLFSADAYYRGEKLGERYGTFLKSDILQLPHHGFGGGDEETYRLIDPQTVLVPVHEREQFATMNIYYPHNPPLIYDLHVEDYFTGGRGNVTLRLPYTPRPNGRELLFEQIRLHSRQAGATAWYFTDMTLENAKFTFVNTTQQTVPVYANLYFDDRADFVGSIKVTVNPCSVTRIDLSDPSQIDGDALYFNRNSLKKKGIKDGAVFTVRFTSKVPVVVTGCKPADYFA